MSKPMRSAKDLKNIVAHSRMSNFPPVNNKALESENNQQN